MELEANGENTENVSKILKNGDNYTERDESYLEAMGEGERGERERTTERGTIYASF